MKISHHSETSRFVNIYLENDEMHELMYDIHDASSKGASIPCLWSFVSEHWVRGKSFEMSLCSVTFLEEGIKFLRDNGQREDNQTTTTSVLAAFSRHASLRLKADEFFQDCMTLL
jgi:hypothetical protein